MERGTITKIVNKSVYILGDFAPGALLETASGAKLLVISRRRELQPEYLEVLRLTEQIEEEPRSVSTVKALLVGGEPPEPGEAVKPYEWPSGRGIFSPEGEADLLSYSVSPHLSVIGSTGTGKTTLVKMILRQAAKRGYRVVILDSHDEYEDVIKELGGTVSPPIIPLCQLSDQELLAATGLLRVSTSPIRLMRYLRYFTKAACKALEQLGDDDMQRKLQKFADAMLLLDIINPNVKSLDEGNNIAATFVKILNEQLGDVVFNALKAIVKREEDRMAAAMMYFTWLLDTARVVRKMDSLPRILSINLLETKQLFSVSDIMLATMSFIFRALIEMKEPSVVVIEEAPKWMEDETSRRILNLFLAQARKFNVMAILVSQKTGDYVQNTRLVIGRIQNTAWARELASLAPQMPGEIARLLPQLRRGEFVYIDGDVTPLRVVI
jgi:Cdc6-like AAA superfamily ATPase